MTNFLNFPKIAPIHHFGSVKEMGHTDIAAPRRVGIFEIDEDGHVTRDVSAEHPHWMGGVTGEVERIGKTDPWVFFLTFFVPIKSARCHPVDRSWLHLIRGRVDITSWPESWPF